MGCSVFTAVVFLGAAAFFFTAVVFLGAAAFFFTAVVFLGAAAFFFTAVVFLGAAAFFFTAVVFLGAAAFFFTAVVFLGAAAFFFTAVVFLGAAAFFFTAVVFLGAAAFFFIVIALRFFAMSAPLGQEETASIAGPGGASAIKCCYAATGMYMTAAAASLCESRVASPGSAATRTDVTPANRNACAMASAAGVGGTFSPAENRCALNVNLDGLKESVRKFERNRPVCTTFAQTPPFASAESSPGDDETTDKPLTN